MRRTLIILVLMVIAAGLTGQTHSRKNMPVDTVFKLNGTVLPVEVTTVTPTYVSFTIPGKSDEYTIERKEVHKIIYKNGRIEILNDAAFAVFDDSNWEVVWLTENKKDVANLYKLGEVDARSPASARSPSAAKKGAIIKLKKKAVNMRGTVVLVTDKHTTGGYGEYPGYYIKGFVYGTEPTEELAEPSSDASSSLRKSGGM
ncbi:MAG: hypothetical protein JW973_16630 [Bacteroidales bacterium]|nr:hypothetical protein [Bacteroidales bacterium]